MIHIKALYFEEPFEVLPGLYGILEGSERRSLWRWGIGAFDVSYIDTNARVFAQFEQQLEGILIRRSSLKKNTKEEKDFVVWLRRLILSKGVNEDPIAKWACLTLRFWWEV